MTHSEDMQRQQTADDEYIAWRRTAVDRPTSIYQSATTEAFQREFWLDEQRQKTAARLAGNLTCF